MAWKRHWNTWNMAEELHHARIYPRMERARPGYPNRSTLAEQAALVERAWQRAQAVVARYKRMKARQRRTEKKLARAAIAKAEGRRDA